MYLKTEELVNTDQLIPKLQSMIKSFYQDLKDGKIVYQKWKISLKFINYIN